MPRVFSKNRDPPEAAHINDFGRITRTSESARDRHFGVDQTFRFGDGGFSRFGRCGKSVIYGPSIDSRVCSASI